MDVVTFVRASAVFPFFQKKRIAEIANNLCSKPVTSIGKAFIENVRKINALLGMPYDLVARGLGSVESVMMYALCALETVSVETKSTEENTRRTQERLKEKFSDPKHKDEFARQIDSGIAEAMKKEGTKEAIEVIRAVTIVLLWTAFEALSRDLWVLLVNTKPNRAQKIMLAVSQEGDGISRKAIEVSLLLEHELDLRGKLGDLLADKFHFSSVSGIRKAFLAADLRQFDADALDSPNLKKLELVRHLLVHRGGIADSKFVRMSNWNARPGEPISLSPDDIAPLCNAAIVTSKALLGIVDQALK